MKASMCCAAALALMAGGHLVSAHEAGRALLQGGGGGPGDGGPGGAGAPAAAVIAPTRADGAPHSHADGEEHVHAPEAEGPAAASTIVATSSTGDTAVLAADGATTGTFTPSKFYSSYTLDEPTYGTLVEVTVNDTYRNIKTNSLPSFETGEFPDDVLPFSLLEVDLEYSIPVDPTYTGVAEQIRTYFAMSVSGIIFKAGTGSAVECEDGTSFRVEASQEHIDFGLDLNNAHVTPTEGLYHYHLIPVSELTTADTDQDIVHVGFAFDGHLVYHSRSEFYTSSYVLNTTDRAGAPCTSPADRDFDEYIAGPTPDGSLLEDWTYTEGAGDLDECNGIMIDGEYAYFVTEAYPYLPRCYMGDISGTVGTPEPQPGGQPGDDGPDDSAGAPGAAGGGGPEDASAPGAATTGVGADGADAGGAGAPAGVTGATVTSTDRAVEADADSPAADVTEETSAQAGLVQSSLFMGSSAAIAALFML